jgi:pimeloyl-ACP methyl ester carboxylesterase
MVRVVGRWGGAAAVLAGLLVAWPLAARADGIDLRPCRLKGVSLEARCGVVSRPLDPANPRSHRIDVQVAVVPAVARNKHPDPIVFFAGGPGQSAIDLAGPALSMLGRFTNRRDIVLIDQRGTGRSAPLECEKPDPWMPLAQAVDVSLAVQRRRACATALAELPHGDLRQYTTTIAVGDVDAIRAALGVSRINLVGVSYGTRVALEYMRLYPRHVRSAVLDGVVPPTLSLPRSFSADNQAALETAFDNCAAEPTCRDRYPRLRAQWEALLSALPTPIVTRHPMSGEEERFVLNRQAVLGAIRRALYVPTLVSAIPAVVSAAASGRFEPLVALGSAGSAAGGMAEGMHFSVLCSEEPPSNEVGTYNIGEDFGDDFHRFYEDVCFGWPRGEVSGGFREIPPATFPTLLLSGDADPATPARHAEAVATRLGPLAKHWVARHASHGALTYACVRDQVYRFVDRAERPDEFTLDSACAERIPRPRAYLPPKDPGR